MNSKIQIQEKNREDRESSRDCTTTDLSYPILPQLLLVNLNLQLIFNFNSNHKFKIHSNSVRKSIARVLTVMNQKQRSNLRELYKGKKYQPLDLRAKKTRAIRRQLTKVSIQN